MSPRAYYTPGDASIASTKPTQPAQAIVYGTGGRYTVVDPSKVEAKPYNPRGSAEPVAVAMASQQASSAKADADKKAAEQQDPEAKRRAALDRLLKPAANFMNMITEIQSRLPLPEKAAATPQVQWGQFNGER
jgi:hypothetical protein